MLRPTRSPRSYWRERLAGRSQGALPAYFEPIAATKGLANLIGGAVGDLLTEDVDPKSLLEAAERSGSP